MLEIPSIAISNDPSIFPNPHTFDPLRFYHLRTSAAGTNDEAGSRHKLAAVGEDSLNFGFGRNACPGRLFAAVEMKAILCRVLLGWEWRNVDGGDGDGDRDREAGGRYRNLDFANFVSLLFPYSLVG